MNPASPTAYRIPTLDVLKGLVMVIMALDHVRDYFHAGSFLIDPTDLSQTTVALFFTRWVTHFCAPVFCMLAGTSAFLAGRRKTKAQLSAFLVSRGTWLVFIEVVVVCFGWYFNPAYPRIGLQTIWALGVSMIALAGLIHLPRASVVAIGLLLVFGHNALDNIHYEGSFAWAALHEVGFFPIPGGHVLVTRFPVLPYIGTMALGYSLGPLYASGFPAGRRRRFLAQAGFGAVALFVAITAAGLYGDPAPWQRFPSATTTVLSFFNRTKYPPSLQYLLMTLGPALLFLAYGENLRGRLSNVLAMYGRVPFFYYILHIYALHTLALVAAQATSFGWHSMILKTWVSLSPELKGYGFSLPVVYLIWLALVAALYPACAWFDRYKQTHKDQVFLSYL